MILRILLLNLLKAPLAADLPEPYDSINDLPFDHQGHFSLQEPLKELIEVDDQLMTGGIHYQEDWIWKTVRDAVKKGANTLHYKIDNFENFWW